MKLNDKKITSAFHLTFFLHFLALSIWWIATSNADNILINFGQSLECFDMLFGGFTILLIIAIIVVPLKLFFSKSTLPFVSELSISVFRLFKLPRPKSYWKFYAAILYMILLSVLTDVFINRWLLDEQVLTFLNFTLKLASFDLKDLQYWKIVICLYLAINAFRVILQSVTRSIYLYIEMQILLFMATAATFFGLFVGQGIIDSLPQKYNLMYLADAEIWYTPIFCCLGVLMVIFFQTMNDSYESYLTERNRLWRNSK